jgi:GntR family transcriptional regulator
MDIDRSSPVPLYHQVYHAILDAVREGRFTVGEPIPSEAELCDLFGVSRITVRQALSDLVRDHHLIRQRPRGRLLARATPIEQRLLRLSSFLIADALAQGHAPRFELERITRVEHDALAPALLRPREGSFVRIDRLLVDRQEPLAKMVSFVPERRCPGLIDRLPAQGAQGSLQRLIEDCYGHKFVDATQWLSARGASQIEADALTIPAQAPVIVIQRLTRTADREPIEYFECLFRADRYEFVMNVAEEA